MNFLTDKPVSQLVGACLDTWRDRKEGRVPPAYNGVEFENYNKLGYCQQHVRKIVEAVIWGEEWKWGDARCCAGATHKALKAKYTNYVGKGYKVGDIIYTDGGGRCRTCGGSVGHVMIVTSITSQVYCWQNTSYQNAGLTITPLRNSQNVVGVYRLFPDIAEEVFKVVDSVSGKVYAALEGKYKVTNHPEQNKVYLTKV